ncbi:MAG TPA: glycosyltransferase [Solirubrobacterales bacterium]
MAKPKFVPIPPQPLDRFRSLLGDEYEQIEAVAAWAREAFVGRAIWHISSTARGGGVAELLRTMLPYVRDAGVDTRWVVLRESPEFFCLTKRIHNRLHGAAGDGGPLGEDERRLYESTLAASGREVGRLCQPGDLIYLHDPQTAGLVPLAKEAGLKVVWRCHVGVDRPNDLVRGTWDFLRPYVEQADAYVFSRRQYFWDGLDASKAWYMPPVIDPFSPKNQELGPATVQAILKGIGLTHDGLHGAPVFVRSDGTPGRVERPIGLLQDEPLPDDARMVAQVSRWDRLKDPLGVLEMLDRHLPGADTHLVLAGPDAGGVADDPEGREVFAEVAEAWRGMVPQHRRRAHLLTLPMYDLEENAAMVNALQRRADVVLQKSLAEGFGLTVAEAMWKRRPLVASRVGGIQDQVLDGETGVLVTDPLDLARFGAAIEGILADPARARRMGEAGKRRVTERFLTVYRLREYVALVSSLLGIVQPAEAR